MVPNGRTRVLCGSFALETESIPAVATHNKNPNTVSPKRIWLKPAVKSLLLAISARARSICIAHSTFRLTASSDMFARTLPSNATKVPGTNFIAGFRRIGGSGRFNCVLGLMLVEIFSGRHVFRGTPI